LSSRLPSPPMSSRGPPTVGGERMESPGAVDESGNDLAEG
jgi:hypothetical protein